MEHEGELPRMRHSDARLATADALSLEVIGAAITVHKELGPGLLESIYHQCLMFELTDRGIQFESEVMLPVRYRERLLDCGLRMDLVVGGLLVVELKAVETVLKVHEAQLLTYMKLGGFPLGLLLNFNTALLKQGIVRRVL